MMDVTIGGFHAMIADTCGPSCPNAGEYTYVPHIYLQFIHQGPEPFPERRKGAISHAVVQPLRIQGGVF